MNQFDKNSLNFMGIHELRKIGRKMGLNSPTTLKKDVLIEQILKKAAGDDTIKARSNRGRPSKDVCGSAGDFDYISNSTYGMPAVTANVAKYVTLSDVTSETDLDDTSKFRDVEGMLDILPDGFGFIRNKPIKQDKDDCYVSTSLIKKFRLKTGDVLQGKANIAHPEKFASFVFLKKVNGQSVDSFNVPERVEFSSLKAVVPKELINTDTNSLSQNKNLIMKTLNVFTPFAKGQRIFVQYPKRIQTDGILTTIVNVLKCNDDLKLVYLGIAKSAEVIVEELDYQTSAGNNPELYYTTFDSSTDEHIKMCEFVSKRVMRLLEQGKNIVFVVDCINEVVKAIQCKKLENIISTTLSLNSLAVLPKRMFALGRNIENGGSVTVVVTSSVDESQEIVSMSKDLEDSCNVKISLEKAYDFADDIVVDVKNSFIVGEKALFADKEDVFNHNIEIRKQCVGKTNLEIFELIKNI